MSGSRITDRKVEVMRIASSPSRKAFRRPSFAATTPLARSEMGYMLNRKSGCICLCRARNDSSRSDKIECRSSSGMNSSHSDGARTTTEISPSAANQPRRAAPSAATHCVSGGRRIGTPNASAINCVHSVLRAPPPIRNSEAMRVPSARRASRPSDKANVTPSRTEYASMARSVDSTSPQNTPCAYGSLWGVRSPERYGRNKGALARLLTLTRSASLSKHPSSADVSLHSQRTQLAADSTTLVRCHLPGIAWQSACTPSSGLGRNRSVTTDSTPEVPRDRNPSPDSAAPTPSALVAVSPPPAATITFLGKPSSLATLPSTTPAARLPSSIGGTFIRVRSHASKSSSDHTRRPTSSQRVPDASDGSVSFIPVRRRRR
jgi:hypothetical protein